MSIFILTIMKYKNDLVGPFEAENRDEALRIVQEKSN